MVTPLSTDPDPIFLIALYLADLQSPLHSGACIRAGYRVKRGMILALGVLVVLRLREDPWVRWSHKFRGRFLVEVLSADSKNYL